MTNEERDLIASFVQRVGGGAAPGAPGQGTVAPMPPVDREADALIADLFNRYPEARYRITQLAFVQEHALVEAQNRIARLQWEVQNAKQQAAPPSGGPGVWGAGAAAAQPAASRGIFGSLFGSSQPAAPQQPQYAPPPPQYGPQYAPPQPSYPPGYNPGLFPQQGTGFFGSALRTAAGVAGGVLAADAISSMFSGHGGGFGGGGFGGGGFGGGFGGGPEVVENITNYNTPPGGNPWGGPDPMDQGGALKSDDDGKFSAPPTVDQSAWSPAPDQGGGGWQQADSGGGWQDAPADQGDQGGGWDDASSDSSSDFSSDT